MSSYQQNNNSRNRRNNNQAPSRENNNDNPAEENKEENENQNANQNQKKARKPVQRVKLEAKHLRNPAKGLRLFYESAKRMKIEGNENLKEADMLNQYLRAYKEWHFHLIPKYDLNLFVSKTHNLGREPEVKAFLARMRKVHAGKNKWEDFEDEDELLAPQNQPTQLISQNQNQNPNQPRFNVQFPQNNSRFQGFQNRNTQMQELEQPNDKKFVNPFWSARKVSQFTQSRFPQNTTPKKPETHQKNLQSQTNYFLNETGLGSQSQHPVNRNISFNNVNSQVTGHIQETQPINFSQPSNENYQQTLVVEQDYDGQGNNFEDEGFFEVEIDDPDLYNDGNQQGQDFGPAPYADENEEEKVLESKIKDLKTS